VKSEYAVTAMVESPLRDCSRVAFWHERHIGEVRHVENVGVHLLVAALVAAVAAARSHNDGSEMVFALRSKSIVPLCT